MESFRRRQLKRIGLLLVGVLLLPMCWCIASIIEMAYGIRLMPYGAYPSCGDNPPQSLPETVKIGLYEEFPVPWRLDKLEQIDFPVSLAVTATSRAEFLQLRAEILETHPQVETVYFWPLLSKDEGYYPGAWSKAEGVRRLADNVEGLPTLWDLEMPLDFKGMSPVNWWRNRSFLSDWLNNREEPVHIWRQYASMGLNPRFLRLIGMHYDPIDYPAVTLHLDLYTTGAGLDNDELTRILRCGVERYGEQFIPSFGVLNDGEGDPDILIPPQTLERYLQAARAAGVHEIWLFGVNGINEEYLSILTRTIPVEELSQE